MFDFEDMSSGAIITALGTIVALVVAAIISRTKDDSDIEVQETDAATRLTGGALALLKTQNERMDEIEDRQVRNRGRIHELQIENIELRKCVSRFELIAEENEKCRDERVLIFEYMEHLYEGTVLNINQLLELGHVPNFIPKPVMRGDHNIEPAPYIAPKDLPEYQFAQKKLAEKELREKLDELNGDNEAT